MEISSSTSPHYSLARSPAHARKEVIKPKKVSEEVTSEKKTSDGIKFVCPMIFSFFPSLVVNFFKRKHTPAELILKSKLRLDEHQAKLKLSIPRTESQESSPLGRSPSSSKRPSRQSSMGSNTSSPKSFSRQSSIGNTSSPRTKTLLQKTQKINPAVSISEARIEKLHREYTERLHNKEEIPMNLEKIMHILLHDIAECCNAEEKRLNEIKKSITTNEPHKKQKQKQKEKLIGDIIENFNTYKNLQNSFLEKCQKINEIFMSHKSQESENFSSENKFLILEENTAITHLNEADNYSDLLEDISEMNQLFKGSYQACFFTIDKMSEQDGSFKEDMIHHRKLINKIVKDVTDCLLDKKDTESEHIISDLSEVALRLRESKLLDSWKNYIEDTDYQTGKWNITIDTDIKLSTNYFPSKMKFSLSEESVKHIRKRHPDFLNSIKIKPDINSDNEGYVGLSPKPVSDVQKLKQKLEDILNNSTTIIYKSASYTNPETGKIIDTPALKCVAFLEDDKTYLTSVWKLYKNNNGIDLHLATAYLDDVSGCQEESIKISDFANDIDNPKEEEIIEISPRK